jgi:hypothetical protein
MLIDAFAALLAPEASLGKRLVLLAITLVVGTVLILVGRTNVRTREAEESGKRAVLLTLFGKTTQRTGRLAVLMGWIRIGAGVFLIVFGIALFFGAFAK